MSGVLAEATGRGDVLIRRGVTNEWAVRWERSLDGGATFAPVSMIGWAGVLELRSITSELWLSLPVALTADGLSIATVTSNDLDSPPWSARTSGSWLINATDPESRIHRLGDGYFYLEG